MALLFVRHGSTALNAGDPADPRDYFRGWTQAPLSDYGVQTIKQTADWFRPVPLQAIYSSDLPRAVQTAQEIAKTTGAQVIPDQRLRPLHVGMLTEQLITPELKEILNKAHEHKDMVIPGGESYNNFLQRYGSIMPDLLSTGQSGNIAVVTHHRNLLALPHMFFGKKSEVKGPPEPGGVMALTQTGLYPIFTPPAVAASSYKEHAAS